MLNNYEQEAYETAYADELGPDTWAELDELLAQAEAEALEGMELLTISADPFMAPGMTTADYSWIELAELAVKVEQVYGIRGSFGDGVFVVQTLTDDATLMDLARKMDSVVTNAYARKLFHNAL